jgi:1,2-diacylglycerol 3-beta-glucosyltransferase
MPNEFLTTSWLNGKRPKPTLPAWLTERRERRRLTLSVQRRRLIYLTVATVGLFLLLERYQPELSAVVVLTGLIVFYTIYLSTMFVVKRAVAKVSERVNLKLLAKLYQAHDFWPFNAKTDLPLAPLQVFKTALAKATAKVWGDDDDTPPPSLEVTPQAETLVQANPLAPLVSVIVPAHNEAVVIRDTVLNLLAMQGVPFELVVIDDRSLDATPNLLSKLEKILAEQGETRFRWYRRADEATPGKSAVLNEALATTTTPYLLVFDADAKVAPDFLSRLLPFVAESSVADNVALVQARKAMSNADTNWLTMVQHLEYCFDAHVQTCRDAVQGAVEARGNGMLVKREALLSVGGWNDASVTDDLDLSTRLHLQGWDIRFNSQATVYEEAILEALPLLRQRVRWAEGSLRRYLDNGWAVLFSRKVGLRTRIDMLVYLIEFLFPLLILADNLLVIATFMLGHGSQLHALLSFSVSPLFAVCFVPALYIGIRRFERPSRWVSLKWAVYTCIYMLFIWWPVAYYTFVKVLLGPSNSFHWAKTTHYGANIAQDLATLEC